MYNLSNLEPKFKNFLLAENISVISIRNYLSDVRHFFGWLIANQIYDNDKNLRTNLASIKESAIENYKNSYLKANLPKKTINRRLSALRKFFTFVQKQGAIEANPATKVNNVSSLQVKPTVHKPAPAIDKTPTRNKMKNKQKAVKFNFIFLKIALAIIILFFPLALFIQHKFKTAQQFVPVLSKQPPNKRYIAFSGKLTDQLGNPIISKTDVKFNLYTAPVGAESVYTSYCIGQDGAITPDVNGNIRVLIGYDCDRSPIDSNIFIDYPVIYLGVTPGSDVEMQPRHKIPNVGYALSSDTLQGLNPGSDYMSIPFINKSGDLLIGALEPGIHSIFESENFTISSAETINVQSAGIGDVVLQASDSGGIKFRTGGISDTYTRLLINNEGNIGIGTLFPSYGLEVNDDIKVTDGNRLIVGSSPTDPSGENGAIYYNTGSGKFRCFQKNQWFDCFDQAETNSIGGAYEGNLSTDTAWSQLETQIYLLTNTVDNLKSKIDTLSKFSLNVLTANYRLLATNLSVSEKITSPIVETTQIKTNEIINNHGDINVILGSQVSDANLTTPESDGDSGQTGLTNKNKGSLASLIIKGLEGKTVAIIDAAGNASFSGQLAANDLLIANNASVSGSLYANSIESENLNSLTQEVSNTKARTAAVEEKISGLVPRIPTESGEVEKTSAVSQSLINDINDIQFLLADLKSQPLPNPNYYQNLDTNQQSTIDNVIMEQLTVTDKSNFYDTAVSNSSTVGSLLLQDNSILSLAWDLKLSALSKIKLFDDTVIISKDGSITAKGKVLAEGGLVTNKIEALNENEAVNIDRLALSNLIINDRFLSNSSSSALIASSENFEINGIFSPAFETGKTIAGDAVIPSQSQEIIIYNSNVTDSSLIYLTPKGQITTSPVSVSKKEPCGSISPEMNETNKTTSGVENPGCKPYFKVSLPVPATQPLAFDWLIIN